MVKTNLFPSVEASSVEKEIWNGYLPVEVEHLRHGDDDDDAMMRSVDGL